MATTLKDYIDILNESQKSIAVSHRADLTAGTQNAEFYDAHEYHIHNLQRSYNVLSRNTDIKEYVKSYDIDLSKITRPSILTSETKAAFAALQKLPPYVTEEYFIENYKKENDREPPEGIIEDIRDLINLRDATKSVLEFHNSPENVEPPIISLKKMIYEQTFPDPSLSVSPGLGFEVDNHNFAIGLKVLRADIQTQLNDLNIRRITGTPLIAPNGEHSAEMMGALEKLETTLGKDAFYKTYPKLANFFDKYQDLNEDQIITADNAIEEKVRLVIRGFIELHKSTAIKDKPYVVEGQVNTSQFENIDKYLQTHTDEEIKKNLSKIVGKWWDKSDFDENDYENIKRMLTQLRILASIRKDAKEIEYQNLWNTNDPEYFAGKNNIEPTQLTALTELKRLVLTESQNLISEEGLTHLKQSHMPNGQTIYDTITNINVDPNPEEVAFAMTLSWIEQDLLTTINNSDTTSTAQRTPDFLSEESREWLRNAITNETLESPEQIKAAEYILQLHPKQIELLKQTVAPPFIQAKSTIDSEKESILKALKEPDETNPFLAMAQPLLQHTQNPNSLSIEEQQELALSKLIRIVENRIIPDPNGKLNAIGEEAGQLFAFLQNQEIAQQNGQLEAFRQTYKRPTFDIEEMNKTIQNLINENKSEVLKKSIQKNLDKIDKDILQSRIPPEDQALLKLQDIVKEAQSEDIDLERFQQIYNDLYYAAHSPYFTNRDLKQNIKRINEANASIQMAQQLTPHLYNQIFEVIPPAAKKEDEPEVQIQPEPEAKIEPSKKPPKPTTKKEPESDNEAEIQILTTPKPADDETTPSEKPTAETAKPVDDNNTTTQQPVSQPLDDRFFNPAVYDQLKRHGKVDGGFVAEKYAGQTLTRADLAKIAVERMEQHARSLDIAPENITEAMIEGHFNPSPFDIMLAYEGIENPNIPDRPRPPEKPQLVIVEFPQNAGSEEIKKYRAEKAEQNATYKEKVERYHEQNAEYYHAKINYDNEIDGYRNQAWGQRYGTIGDIQGERVTTAINGTERSATGNDLALRMVLKTTGDSNLEAMGLSNDPFLSYNEAIEIVKTKSPKVQEYFHDKMGMMREQSPVSYFDLAYHDYKNYTKQSFKGFATYDDYKQLRNEKYSKTLQETGYKATSKIEANEEINFKLDDNDKLRLFRDNADDHEHAAQEVDQEINFKLDNDNDKLRLFRDNASDHQHAANEKTSPSTTPNLALPT